MSQYPIPPPSYGSTSPSPKSPNPPIYSGVSYHDEPGSSAGIYNQPAADDLPDDFKVGSLLSTRLMRPLTLWIVWCLCNGELY
jgi:protein lifeguard